MSLKLSSFDEVIQTTLPKIPSRHIEPWMIIFIRIRPEPPVSLKPFSWAILSKCCNRKRFGSFPFVCDDNPLD
jgi:hypothetical protein